jgi:predicted porin
MNRKIMSALLVSAAMCGPALAADLGGDCCADLEERVAELEATAARKGNRKVSLTIYGQVNTGLMYFDNGSDSNLFVIDNQVSNSRFGLRGEAKINPSMSAGFLIEVAAGLGAESSAVTETNDDGSTTGDNRMEIRHASWYLAHNQLGKLTVGRTSMSTDAISEIDLGGANIVAQSGLYFGNDIQVSGTGKRFDSFATGNYEFDRNNAVRYDTATAAGFQASAAFGENDRWDIALRYAGEFSGFRLAAGIGYGVGSDNSDVSATAEAIPGFDEARILLGSASVLHVGSGLFLSGSAARRDVDVIGANKDVEQTYWSVRGGIAKNWFGIGNTVLYGEYHKWHSDQDLTVSGLATTSNEAAIWGLGVVQNIDAAAMELYLAYKNHGVDLNGPGATPDTEDTHLVISGARIRF